MNDGTERNEVLIQQIEAAGWRSVLAFCKGNGLLPCQGAVYDLINRTTPALRSTGEWSVVAARVAEALGEMPEDLFADERCEIEARAGLMRQRELGLATIESVEARHDVRVLLKNRPARETGVLFSRFGEGLTLDSVAKDLGVTRERVRQIEAKAIRVVRGRISKQEEARRARTTTVEQEWQRARALAEVQRKKDFRLAQRQLEAMDAARQQKKASAAERAKLTAHEDRERRLQAMRDRWAAMEAERERMEAERRYLKIIAEAEAAKDAVLRKHAQAITDTWWASHGYPAEFKTESGNHPLPELRLNEIDTAAALRAARIAEAQRREIEGDADRKMSPPEELRYQSIIKEAEAERNTILRRQAQQITQAWCESNGLPARFGRDDVI